MDLLTSCGDPSKSYLLALWKLLETVPQVKFWALWNFWGTFQKLTFELGGNFGDHFTTCWTFGQLLELGALELLLGLLSVQLLDFGELFVNFRTNFLTFGQFGLTFGTAWQALCLTFGLWGTFGKLLDQLLDYWVLLATVWNQLSVRISCRRPHRCRLAVRGYFWGGSL